MSPNYLYIMLGDWDFLNPKTFVMLGHVQHFFIVGVELKLAKEISPKCLKILAVINVLPPPGGPIALTRVQSVMNLKHFSLSLLSYQPPWSKYYLSISIGGCASHFSFCGMFKSSIKITPFPTFGPKTPFFLLSSLESTISYVYVQVVCALKDISITRYNLGSKMLFRICLI